MATIVWLLLSLTVTLTTAVSRRDVAWLARQAYHQDMESRRLCSRVTELEERLEHLVTSGQQRIADHLHEWEEQHVAEFHEHDEHDDCHMSCHGTHTWGYGPADGAHCWGDCIERCKGTAQSPIDLKSSLAVSRSFSSSVLMLRGYDLARDGVMKNNGHTAVIALTGESDAAMIEGLGLPGVYRAAQLHFHWGGTSAQGSEHTVDGRQYPMEMHIVHYNTEHDEAGKAMDKPRGLAVLGFFFVISPEDNPALAPIIAQLHNVANPGSSVALEPFRLIDLIPRPEDLTYFYRYQGSLTTPPCYETVEWTVFPFPIEISDNQLKEFRRLKTGGHGDQHPMVDNFRPTMPLNGRALYYSSVSGITVP